jgi:polysaccharide export outer membrane protein
MPGKGLHLVPPSLTTWPIALFLFAAVPATSLQAAPQPPPSKPYSVNPGDQLEIYVWGEERLQRSIRVLPDGTFSFPLAGRILAQGLSTTDIEQAITKGLSSQYNGTPPQVTVSVSQPSGYVFSVLGRVKGPGNFTPGRFVNVMEGIAMAGGPDEFANLDNVTIVRKTATGLTAQRIRLNAAMKGNISEGSVTIPQLEVGDTVIVP